MSFEGGDRLKVDPAKTISPVWHSWERSRWLVF